MMYKIGTVTRLKNDIFSGILNWKGLLLTFMALFAEYRPEKKNGKSNRSPVFHYCCILPPTATDETTAPTKYSNKMMGIIDFI